MTEGPSWAIPMGPQVTSAARRREEAKAHQSVCEKCGVGLAAVGAAKRIKAELARADEGNYGRNGWASYIAREDVETVARAVVG